MDMLRSFLEGVLGRFLGAFSYNGPFGAPAMLGALAACALFYVGRRRARERRASLRGFIKAIFPRKVMLHRSTKLDLRLWGLNVLILLGVYGSFAFGETFWRDLTLGFLNGHFGAHAGADVPTWLSLGVVTIAMLLAYEFGYWSIHYLLHVVPALWEFHKVHHSAEVLTTLTEMRQHPVEIISVINSIALWTGLTYGLCIYVFGPGAHPFTLFNVNIGIIVFLLTIGHLRHTNLWIAFGGFAGKIFQSPAHHQIHHSDQAKHFNKNLGFALAVWDWAFGTLYLPKTHEKITFGVGAAHVDFQSIASAFGTPFLRAAAPLLKRVARWRAAAAKPGPADAQGLRG